jgi:hypothetical protein
MNINETTTLLFSYFVIALVFEHAMSIIFNWRVFLNNWNNKGLKTVILVGSSATLTFSLGLNIFEKLLPSLGQSYTNSSDPGLQVFFTALFIAGGSSGIYEVLKKTVVRDEERRNLITRNKELETNVSELVNSILDITDEKVVLKNNINFALSDRKKLEDQAKIIRNIIIQNKNV